MNKRYYPLLQNGQWWLQRSAGTNSCSGGTDRMTGPTLRVFVSRPPRDLNIPTIAVPTPALSLHIRRIQRRCFASEHRGRNFKNRKGGNPFKVLGISESSTFAAARTSFLKIAMENHPDTSNVEDVDERNKMRDRFIAAKSAFSQMVAGPDGEIVLKEEAEAMGESFDAWFKQETGKDIPFSINLDPQTIKEVAKYTEEVGSTGLDRDGGMWTLANMITNAAKNGKDAQSILRLESGDVKRPNDQVDGVLRRKRRDRGGTL